MLKVFVNGKEGTTGLKLYERLEKRGGISFLNIPEADRKNPAIVKKFINDSDVTFFCLPDAAAVEAAALCENPDVKIIDASTAHRTAPSWAYGFPELSEKFKSAIENGKRIAVPGCHASGFIALVYPLIASGIMPTSYPLVCNSLTGYSGGGKSMIKAYEENPTPDLASPRVYGISQQHKHLKEMQAIAGLDFPPLFTPVVSNFYSGMAITVPLYSRLLIGAPSAKDLHAVLNGFYAGKRMIRVADFENGDYKDGFIAANGLALSNKMLINVSGNSDRVLLTAVFDNLGKGASGAAVQCMNLMCGADEALGL
ncbi:MAG: N-acetyl-gamma-glutamyl-phosphate reductase [Clostridiaceae bacterium]|jgi:N-acetyl-gamma-glutamyl-phosphate reductase|nr:N-acetyl-gamma-glutamyl-phosphate reductase [Clostridiaceae bacterium]